MMHPLREYQEAYLQAVAHCLSEGKRAPLVVCPTGGGKSVVLAELIRRHASDRVLVLAHRKELVFQLYETVSSRVESVAIWAAPYPKYRNVAARVQVASVGTILKRTVPGFAPTLIIIDEAHRYAKGEFKGLLDRYPEALRVGFTATPQRSDGTPLGDAFDDLICCVSAQELTEMGNLVPCTIIGPDKRLGAAARDQDDEEAGEVDLAQPPLEAYLQHAAGKKTVIFAHNVKAAMEYERQFKEAGIKAIAAHGEMPAKKRRLAVDCFKRGFFDVLINVFLFTEGFDHPGTEVCIMARACRSELTYLQCLDDSTEILTKDGFKSRGQIAVGDLVAGFDINSSEVKWVPALSAVDRGLNADEDMYALSGPAVDIRVTGGHRMVTKVRTTIEGQAMWPSAWRLETAERTSRRSGFKIPLAGVQRAPGLPLTNAELRFIGWFLTDGTMNKHTKQVVITQAVHQPQIHDLRQCLKDCGFDFKEYSRIPNGFANGKPQITFHVPKGTRTGSLARNGWHKLEPYLKKDFAPELEDLDSRQLSVLLGAAHLGDGSKARKATWDQGSYHIFTSNKTFADRLQSLCVRRGFKCNVTKRDEEHGLGWTLHIKGSGEAVYAGSHVPDRTGMRKVPSTAGERVWCVENELGTIIVRRNGKVAVVGNCVGRILRPAPGKTECLLVDLTGAFLEHGRPDDDREYSLTGKAITRNAPTQCPACGLTMPVKDIKLSWLPESCPKCAALQRSAYRHCPACGHHISKLIKPRKDAVIGNVELKKTEVVRPKITDWGPRRRHFDKLVQDAAARKFKPGWVGYEFQKVYGRWPTWKIPKTNEGQTDLNEKAANS